MYSHTQTKDNGTINNLEHADYHANRNAAYLRGSNLSRGKAGSGGYPLLSGWWAKRAFAGLILLLVLASCHKQDAPQSTLRTQQEQLVRDLSLPGKVKIPTGTPELANSLHFKTLEEAKAYFRLQGSVHRLSAPVTTDKINSLFRENNIGLTATLGGGGGLTLPGAGGDDGRKGQVKMSMWGGINGYNVHFAYNIDDDGVITATDFTSIFSGFTLGQDYKQTSFYSWTYPGSSIVYFEIIGEKDYSLFVGGVGTYMTRVLTIKGSYNYNTEEKDGIVYEGDRSE